MELVIISETTRVTASSNAPSPHSARTFRACPRAEATAGRYAPSSRKDRSGNPLSQLSDVNHGGLGMTDGMSVCAFVALTVRMAFTVWLPVQLQGGQENVRPR